MRFLPSRPTRASAGNIRRSLCCLLCGAVFLAAMAASAVAQSSIGYRSSATADTGAGASSITVNKPAGTVTNDVMIANLFVRGLTQRHR